MKSLLRFIFLLAIMVSLNLRAQDSKKENEVLSNGTVKQMVNAQRYVFLAQSVSPLSGGVIQMTSLYTFTVLPDTILSDLPYYGRVYMPSLNPADAGVKFTSLTFGYSTKEKKKGGWEIKIKPKDVRSSPLIFLTISADGYAALRMSSSDRQAISYNGRIEGIKQKTK
jgi:hypothetical protein